MRIIDNMDQGWEIQDPFYNALYQAAAHLLKVRQNALHARVSYHFALTLLEMEGGDPRVVLPAILLHDLGYSQIPLQELSKAFGPKIENPDLHRYHEVEGVRLAGEILGKIIYPVELIREIQCIIDGHDTRLTARDINDKIVKDADKLWRFSYEGFVIDLQRFDYGPGQLLDKITALIPRWFFTHTSKTLAAQEAHQRRKELCFFKDFASKNIGCHRK
jgi:hypothetical protein